MSGAAFATSPPTLTGGTTTGGDGYGISLLGANYDNQTYVDIRSTTGSNILLSVLPPNVTFVSSGGGNGSLNFKITDSSLQSMLTNPGLRFYVVSPTSGYQFAGPLTLQRTPPYARAPTITSITTSGADGYTIVIQGANYDSQAYVDIRSMTSDTIIGQALPPNITYAPLGGTNGSLTFTITDPNIQYQLATQGLRLAVVSYTAGYAFAGPTPVTRPNKAVIYSGGSDFVWYYVTAQPTCTREPYAFLPNYHSQVPAGTPYGTQTVQAVVKQQLAQMYANGQRKIGMRPFLGWQVSTGTVVDFSNALPQSYLTNLHDFLVDAKAAGFQQVTMDMGWINHTPDSWTSYDSNVYNKYWTALTQIRTVLVNSGMPYEIGLDSEFAPPTTGNPYWIQFVQNLWNQYKSTYGIADTFGYAVPSGTGTEADMQSRVTELQAIYGSTWPKFVDIHIYEEPTTMYAAAHQALNAIGQTTIPIRIGETYFNNATDAAAFQSEVASTGRKIWNILQWPVAEPRVNTDCGNLDTAPPAAYNNYNFY